MIGGSSPGEGWEYFFHHRVQTGSEAYPASYPMGTRGSSLGLKSPGCEADHSSPSSRECVELYLHSPNTPPWLGAQLKHRDYFTLPYNRLNVKIWLVSCPVCGRKVSGSNLGQQADYPSCSSGPAWNSCDSILPQSRVFPYKFVIQYHPPTRSSKANADAKTLLNKQVTLHNSLYPTSKSEYFLPSLCAESYTSITY
jgi:hypothetical protein